MTEPIDPRQLSHLADLRTTRRRFISRGAVLLGGLAISPAVLAACGSSKSTSSGDATATTVAGSGVSLASLSGTSMTMFNWPL